MGFRQLHALHGKRKDYVSAYKTAKGDIFVFVFPDPPDKPTREDLVKCGRLHLIAAVTIGAATLAFLVGIAFAVLRG